MEEWRKKCWIVWRKTKRAPSHAARKLLKLGKDDPRRAIHAVKVGLALTLVSLLYLLEPLFQNVGQNAIWAVMTVVVVLEFTAGATLCKGLNRGLGTILAGSLAFVVEYIAEETGPVFRAIFIGGAAATYMRFLPYVKKNYDYGVLIFILTFNLITVSSFRVTNVLKIAQERFITIAIGCAICLFMSLLIFPIWSGQDLHNSTVNKLQGLATSIEACVNEYFREDDDDDKCDDEDPIYKGYKAVLDSKSIDEALALYASWEPRHSRNCRYPWQQYVKVGAALRRFSYTVVALHGCLQTEIQVKRLQDKQVTSQASNKLQQIVNFFISFRTTRSCRELFKDPCTRVASEVSKVLMELAISIQNRRHCSPEILTDNLQKALHDLNNAIKSQPRLFLGSNTNQATNMLAMAAAQAREGGSVSISTVKTDSSALMEWKTRHHHNHQSKKELTDQRKVLRPQLSKIAMMTCSLEFCEALPFAAFASLLVEMVAKLDSVMEEIDELARVGCFKEYNGDDVVVNVGTPRVNASDHNLPSHFVD
ncbi:Aluminum-activated malate transporter 12 [Linum perenne]